MISQMLLFGPSILYIPESVSVFIQKSQPSSYQNHSSCLIFEVSNLVKSLLAWPLKFYGPLLDQSPCSFGGDLKNLHVLLTNLWVSILVPCYFLFLAVVRRLQCPNLTLTDLSCKINPKVLDQILVICIFTFCIRV